MLTIEREGMTLVKREDGYVNATALCKSGGKEWKHYVSNSGTRAFLGELSGSVGIPTDDLVRFDNRVSNAEKGTYVHPLVAINLGQWISPRFAVFVSECMLGIIKSAKPVSPVFNGLISPAKTGRGIYPPSLRYRIETLYKGLSPFIYTRITDKALGEGAAAELKRICPKSSNRFDHLTAEGLYKMKSYLDWLDINTAPCTAPADFEAVLFTKQLEQIA